MTLIPGHGSGEHSRLMLQELWPRFREESRCSCKTRAHRQDSGTENKGVRVLASSSLHYFKTSRRLALVTQ